MRRLVGTALAMFIASSPGAEDETECRKAMDQVLPSIHTMFRAISDLQARTEKLSSCPSDIGRLKQDLANIMKLAESTSDAEKLARSACAVDSQALQEVRAMTTELSRFVKEVVSRCEVKK